MCFSVVKMMRLTTVDSLYIKVSVKLNLNGIILSII